MTYDMSERLKGVRRSLDVLSLLSDEDEGLTTEELRVALCRLSPEEAEVLTREHVNHYVRGLSQFGWIEGKQLSAAGTPMLWRLAPDVTIVPPARRRR